jgi:hypothetical protein
MRTVHMEYLRIMKSARHSSGARRALLVFIVVLVGMVILTSALVEVFRESAGSLANFLLALATAVLAAAAVATLDAQISARSKPVKRPEPATAEAVPPEIDYRPPDSNVVSRYVTRVLLAIDNICRELPSGLSEDAGGDYVERAVNNAKAALGSAERERLRSRGLDPRILIGLLPGSERAAWDWTSGDPDSASMLEGFRSQLLDLLGSDQAEFLPPSTRQFLRDARKQGKRDEKKVSVKWAGVLTLLDAGFGEPGVPETEKAQALAWCRLPQDLHFIGRSSEIKEAVDKIELQMKTSGSAVVWVTGEEFGVGVSMMTKKLARTLYERGLFPGGVLYSYMDGLAGEKRVTAESVATKVLATRGVEPGARPFAAYEAAMRGERILLVLDDAADESHVAPLAKRMDSCCVLVASRKHSQECADFLLPVPRLPRHDSIELLLKHAGPPPRRGWPDSVRQPCGDLAGYVEDLPMEAPARRRPQRPPRLPAWPA